MRDHGMADQALAHAQEALRLARELRRLLGGP